MEAKQHPDSFLFTVFAFVANQDPNNNHLGGNDLAVLCVIYFGIIVALFQFFLQFAALKEQKKILQTINANIFFFFLMN